MDLQAVQKLSACTVHPYLYSKYRPDVLYRTYVPVQYTHNPTSLYAEQPAQNLSACTVQLYLNISYGLYSL